MAVSQKAGQDLPFAAEEASRRLLAWYGCEGRELPWRNTRDPYRIWLSEVMLQQTTVAAVIPYYERFLECFPNIEALASAPLDDVIALWAGLGYYSRARNLHRAAIQVVEEFDSCFPDELKPLMSLPGIGRSTAGAILSIAFDKPVPILDGNVRRVLVRLFAWQEDPRSSVAEKQLWLWAEALTPLESSHDYAQAIMDLGATVCTPRDPACGECPLQQFCLAFDKDLASSLPRPRSKKPVPVRNQVAVIVRSQEGTLLRQRPPEGFLGGMWELPVTDLDENHSPEPVAQSLLVELGLRGELVEISRVKHAYSHFKLDLTVFSADVVYGECAAEGAGYRWIPEEEMTALPLHGAHKKAYAKTVN